MLFIITPDDENVLKTSFIPHLDYTNSWNCSVDPISLFFCQVILIRLGLRAVFQTYDKYTSLDRCGMRLRTFADIFNIAIVFSHFCQYIYS